MDLKSRIRRRRRTGTTATLVLDYEAISPIAHVSEPTGRGPVLERLLDYLDPVFDGDLPPNAYVWGPIGAGKSAVVTALWANLEAQLSESQSVIHTTTRSQTANAPQFVYVDSREASSTFAQYRAILDAISDESVPEKGIGTDTLGTRLTDSLRAGSDSVLVAVDHVGEPETPDLATVADRLDPFGESLTWVAVGRTDPQTLAVDLPPERIELPAYRRHDLVDILTSRASEGLAERALQHEQTREIADWAEGNAHDAFAALFGAADRAARKGRSRVHSEDITAGMMDVPRPSPTPPRSISPPAPSSDSSTNSPRPASSNASSGNPATTPTAVPPAASNRGSRSPCSDASTTSERSRRSPTDSGPVTCPSCDGTVERRSPSDSRPVPGPVYGESAAVPHRRTRDRSPVPRATEPSRDAHRRIRVRSPVPSVLALATAPITPTSSPRFVSCRSGTFDITASARRSRTGSSTSPGLFSATAPPT
jgi:hypothetical protein